MNEYPPLEAKRVAVRLVVGGLAIAAVLCVIGWTIVAIWPAEGLFGEASASAWLEDHRTPTFDTLTLVGSYLSDTKVCITVLIISMITLRLWLGRWRESMTVLTAIVGELLVFLIVTALVNRDRPDVVHLDPAPPTSSFPSGHVAAAVALYGCLAIILLRELRPHWLAVVLAVLLFAIPVIVATSRMYRGMHFPSDVTFGFLGGGAWLVVTLTTVLAHPRRFDRDEPPPGDGPSGAAVTASHA